MDEMFLERQGVPDAFPRKRPGAPCTAATTLPSLWRGEQMDHGMAVEALIRRE